MLGPVLAAAHRRASGGRVEVDLQTKVAGGALRGILGQPPGVAIVEDPAAVQGGGR